MKARRWTQLLAPLFLLGIFSVSWIVPTVLQENDLLQQRYSVMLCGPGGRPIVYSCMNGLLEWYISSGSIGGWNAWTVQWWREDEIFGHDIYWKSFDAPHRPQGLTASANEFSSAFSDRMIGPVQVAMRRSVPGGPPPFAMIRTPIWPWIVLSMLWLFAHAVPLGRQRRRRRRGLCIYCGYDLRHSPGRCPECGAAVAP